MSIWEEIYCKHREGGKVSDDQPADHGQQKRPVASDPAGGRSLKADAVPSRDEFTPGARPQPVTATPTPPAAEPQEPPKPARARFVPRTSPANPLIPYPALLSKMRSSLSDTWANLMLETKQSAQTLLFCGSSGREGVTLISYHMAMFLSKEYSMKVLYIDTNLNHAAIGRIQNLPGVYSFVSENVEIAPLIVQTEYPGLYLLPSGSGTIAKNVGGNMLSREPIETLMRFCREHFDMTIIDGQPLVSSPVMVEFARVADVTLLVCRYGYSRHEVSRMAIDKLRKYGISSIGAILNDRKFPVPQKLYKLMG